MISNGSFDDRDAGWIGVNEINTNGKGGTGDNCLIFRGSAAVRNVVLKNNIKVFPSEVYEYTYVYQTSSDADGSEGNQKMRISNSEDGSLISATGWNGVQTSWARKTKTFTVPSNVYSLQISFMCNISTGWVKIDDIELKLL